MGAHAARFAASSRPERRLLLSLGEIAYGRRCWGEYTRFVRQDFLAAARMCVRRVFHFWVSQPYKAATNRARPLLNALFLASRGD